MFRNCKSDATDNNSFGLGLPANNEVDKHIDYMFGNLFFSSTNYCTVWCTMFQFHIQKVFCILEK